MSYGNSSVRSNNQKLMLVEQQLAQRPANVPNIHKSFTLKTVVDSGPLTIELVRTARGRLAYKFTARTVKLATVDDLNDLRLALTSELIDLGILAPHDKRTPEQKKAADKEYREKNHDKLIQNKRDYWAKNKEEINRKRREKAEIARLQRRNNNSSTSAVGSNFILTP